MKRFLGTTLLMTACALFAGTTTRPAKAFGAMSRFLSDGSADPAWSGLGTGRRIYDPPDSAIESIARWGAKLYVTGTSDSGAPRFLARLNSDGTMDTTFGLGGVTTGDFSSGTNGPERWVSMVVQNTGQVVVLGGTPNDPYLVRYNTDGSLDLNFGTQGRMVPFTNFVEGATMSSDIDGKLLVASSVPSGHTFPPQLSRVAPFGERERVITQPTCTESALYTTHIFGDSSRRVTAVGFRSDDRIQIARYVTDQLMADAFGYAVGGGAGCPSGVFSTPVATMRNGFAAAMHQNKVVVAVGRDSTIDFFRVRENGTMDTWRGTYSFPEAASDLLLTRKISVTPGGAYMITGSAVFRGTRRPFAVKLLSSTPAADTTYGWGGYRHLTFQPYQMVALDSLLDPLERIVIAGMAL